MIADSIENKKQYENLGDGFKLGFEFIEKCVAENLPAGKYELDGKNVYASVQEYDSKTEGRFEGHREYIDIQFIVSGEELMEWKQRSEAKANTEYNTEKDVEFFDVSDAVGIPFKKNEFAVFFPNDVHRPGMKLNESVPVKKVVVKIHK